MNGKNVNVAFILDDGFVIPTITAIVSLIENKKPDTVCNIYLVTNNLSHENVLLFENLRSNNLNISVIKLNEDFKNVKELDIANHVSNSAMIKFMLPNIMPDIDKLLYLDGDIIIQKDLLSLYNTDLKDNYAGVVEDLIPRYRFIEPQLERLNIKPHERYFNSGVMLLNLKKMREDDISNQLFEYRKNGLNLFMDQDALNVVFKNRVVFLSVLNNFLMSSVLEFNISELNNYCGLNGKYKSMDELVKQSCILHFTSKYKPWLYFNTPYGNIWNHYFSKTGVKNSFNKRQFILDKSFSKVENLVVSLTSHLGRINTVDKAIKSLLSQTVHPKKIILVLESGEFPNKERDLPKQLSMLLSDKFEILWISDKLRSYGKLIPVLKKYPNNVIVTVDDDIIYPRDCLKKLYEAYKENSNMIHCHRAHRIVFDKQGNILPYQEWVWKVRNIAPSFNNFLTGCAGVLYPPHVLNKDIFNIKLFRELSPTADDIWFWAMAVLNNTKINIIKDGCVNLNYIKGTQQNCLCELNVASNKNDEQLKSVLEHYPEILKKLDKKKFVEETSKEPFIKRVFSVVNRQSKTGRWYKVVYFLGLKFSFRNKKKEARMMKKNG